MHASGDGADYALLPMNHIAVIGAGLSGLVIATELASHHDVTVFEKSLGAGGRMATRRVGDLAFDHGTQFFTAQQPAFQAFLQPLIEQGVVASWNAQFAELRRGRIVNQRQWDNEFPHFVGTPAMNSPAKWLASRLDLRLAVMVARMEQRDSRWRLVDSAETELGLFDWVVVAVPAPQAATLVPASSTLRQESQAARMLGCYSMMLADSRALDLPWQAAAVQDADISWISVNSSKPGRRGPYCLVAHSTNEWAEAHIDDDAESVTAHLLAECSAVLGTDCRTAAFHKLHRWRYANIDRQETAGYGIDANRQLAACGDWYIRGRVEDAFTSALRLAGELKAQI